MSHHLRARAARPGTRAGRWLARALIAVTVVTGVLAMHGLTINHDTGMSGMSTQSAVASAQGGMTMATEVGTGFVETARAFADRAGSLSDPGMAGMVGACVAILTVLLILTLMLTLVGASRRSSGLGVLVLSSALRTSRTWLTTQARLHARDLAELSVLRT